MNMNFDLLKSNQMINRKAFLQKAGRWTLLFSLVGLGGFLFTRNTCSESVDSMGNRTNQCGACGLNSDCTLTKAEKYRASSVQTGRGD